MVDLNMAAADALLPKDLPSPETRIKKWNNAVKLNLNQLTALMNFGYNAGGGRMSREFKEMVETTDFAGICDKLTRAAVNKDNALLERRAAEADLCK
jgi:GH24 family phage-related lysozyme (muramidase)